MAKKTTAPTKTDTAALTHNPFAALAGKRDTLKKPAEPVVVPPFIRVPPAMPARAEKPAPPRKVNLRLETKGRSGKVVTRITGLPPSNLEAIAARLRKALGCGATVEDTDVVLLGTLEQRAREWLSRAGDLSAILPEPIAPQPKPPNPAVPEESRTNAASPSAGTRRSDIRRGGRVAIVMKADQSTGALTEGIVRDLLTNSEVHPRGIKVRLESGEIGRVRIVFD